MGLYVQGQNSTSRRKSVDDIELNGKLISEKPSNGGVLIQDGHKIDLGRDSVINPNDIQEFLRQKRKNTRTYRVRKRTNQLLHTHIALIFVCILSSLDAACVIGQIICDILIMSDSLNENEKLHERTTEILYRILPEQLSEAQHERWLLERVIEYLEETLGHGNGTDPHGNNHSNDTADQHHHDGSSTDHPTSHHRNETTVEPSHEEGTHHSSAEIKMFLQKMTWSQSLHRRQKRSAAHGDSHAYHESHTVLEELTHIFHIGSMAILSVLVAEIFLKTFAMWKHFLNHKLEVFDAFVVIVSWCLDVAFWEGIWARPGQEGATILIFILPWRVVRIVNSFVLVIQEKDLVQLKVVKQLLRRSLRRERELSEKLERYKLEVRQLQGLCKKHAIDDKAINACDPANNPAAGKRRRSSLFGSLQTLAVNAFRKGRGHHHEPEPDQVSTSSSTKDDDIDTSKVQLRWHESVTSNSSSNPVSFSLTPGIDDTPDTAGVDNEVFRYDDETIERLRDENDNQMMFTRL